MPSPVWLAASWVRRPPGATKKATLTSVKSVRGLSVLRSVKRKRSLTVSPAFTRRSSLRYSTATGGPLGSSMGLGRALTSKHCSTEGESSKKATS